MQKNKKDIEFQPNQFKEKMFEKQLKYKILRQIKNMQDQNFKPFNK